MLVFDERCIRNDLWMKVHEKGEKIHILGISGGHVPVHLECVPVHPSRTQCVLVHVRGVPVHPVLFSQFRPVFIFWSYIAHFLSDLSDSSDQLK